MSPTRLCSAALVGLLLGAPLAAQQTTNGHEPDGRILGVVVDDDTGAPIPGALVLLGNGRLTETDDEGRFSFLRVRPGAHKIAAVAPGCAAVEGGFDVHAGRDARLQLVIERPDRTTAVTARHTGGTSRVIRPDDLRKLGNRSLLEALQHLVPNTFEVVGHSLALQTRRGAASDLIIEPLLMIDGVRMGGLVAQALSTIHSDDVARIDVHLGSVAGWEFQPDGAPAVIEVTMRRPGEYDNQRRPESCIDWSAH